MSPIAAIDAGLSYHELSLDRPPFDRFFGSRVDVRKIAEADLTRYPVLLVPCRTNARLLTPYRDAFAAYLEAGGFLVVMGETHPDLWIDGISVRPVPTNFWWWTEKGADLGIRISAPDHPLFRYIDTAAATWHVHGTIAVPEEGHSLLDWHDEGSLMVEARHGSGRLLVTTLDPFYHHGSGFMPTTTRFLAGFLPWLAEEAACRNACGDPASSRIRAEEV
jgi:hypothetical protein